MSAGSKSVSARCTVQEGMPHLAVGCLKESSRWGRSFILDLLHAETLARVGLRGSSWLPSLRIVQFPFGNRVRIFFYRAPAQPNTRPVPTREDSVRGSTKAFRISPWRIYYRLQDSKELWRIFLHPNVVPNHPKDWHCKFCCEEEGKRKRKFALPRSATRGTIN